MTKCKRETFIDDRELLQILIERVIPDISQNWDLLSLTSQQDSQLVLSRDYAETFRFL